MEYNSTEEGRYLKCLWGSKLQFVVSATMVSRSSVVFQVLFILTMMPILCGTTVPIEFGKKTGQLSHILLSTVVINALSDLCFSAWGAVPLREEIRGLRSQTAFVAISAHHRKQTMPCLTLTMFYCWEKSFTFVGELSFLGLHFSIVGKQVFNWTDLLLLSNFLAAYVTT